MTPEQFGAAIRARRKAWGLRQADLAAVSGLGQRFIVELEAGKPTAQIGKAFLVAELLGIPVSLGSASPAPSNDLFRPVP
jgi:HTH-type transcriptional regulator / antitoxin HipB